VSAIRGAASPVYYSEAQLLWEAVMRGACILAVLVVGTATAADGDRQLKVHPARGLPPIESVTVYQTKDGTRQSIAEAKKFDKTLVLPGEGPFEVWMKPKGGLAIRVLDKLTVKAGETHDLKLGDLVGTIEVFGDNFPRAEKIVLTDTRDAGPGEKGHVAVQTAKDYREAMAVPPGTYAVWVVPANGAKPQRVEDNVRVLAGRSTRVGD
jgi:hypothetical protein